LEPFKMEKTGVYREDLMMLQQKAMAFVWPEKTTYSISCVTLSEEGNYTGTFALELSGPDTEQLEEALRAFQQDTEVTRALEPTWIQSFWDWLTKTKG